MLRGRVAGQEDRRVRKKTDIPQTPMGVLARDTKEVLQCMEHQTKFRVKVMERAGTSLQNLLSQTSIWKGLPCGRTECVPYTQGGEEIPPCTKSNVVYENICVTCNPHATEKGDLETDQPSFRILQERMNMHWGAFKRRDKVSHIRKQQELQHPGQEPVFLVKAGSYHRSALSRQIKEAVRIRGRV